MATTEEVLARLVERVEGRFYGKYRGQVTDNDDPGNLGRVKATVPRLLGDAETGWALPAFAYGGASEQGLFLVPDVGAGVWIEFEGGDLSYPVWSGTWYTSGDIPESAQPGTKVLKTQTGHKLVLDDDAGSVDLVDSNGNSLHMDQGGIILEDSFGNSITLDASGVTISDMTGNSVQLSAAGVTVNDGALEVLP
jgi:uncharacterized protein involved in type VI secretion and phage assembly